MSNFIPKEKLTAYQRWELAAFDEAEREAAPAVQPAATETAQVPAEPLPPVILPTAEDVERMHAEAHEIGYATGYEEGIRQGQLEAAQIDALMKGLQRSLHTLEQDVAEQLLAVSLEVASQVLRQSLRVQPELLLPVIREAIAALYPHIGHPSLFIHPDDAALVHTQLGEQLSHNNWRIVEDATITPGGCRVDVGASEVDATLDTRWRRVIEAIGVSQEWLSAKP
jgi:flagellar assembly protein FliH